MNTPCLLRRATLSLLLGGGLVACGGEAAPPALDPAERALVEEALALGPRDIDDLVRCVDGLSDPILRQAAVMDWVSRNAGALAPGDGQRACGLLDGPTRDFCLRRVDSPHLRAAP